MKRKVKVCLLSILLVGALLFAAVASGGTSDDPLVSQSYADGTFFDSVISNARAKVQSAVSSFKNKYISKADSAANIDIGDDASVSAFADTVLEALQSGGKYLYSSSSASPRTLMAGDLISADSGTVIIATDGSFKCASGSVINLTQGKEVSAGNSLGRYTAFMFPENGGSVEIISKTAKVLIDGRYSVAGYKTKYMDEAYALKKLGLVRGAADGMELYRGNTRAESITMLIRLLGEESRALEKDHYHPFGDVAEWAKRYVGYAYQSGYTKGVSNTRYDGQALTTAGQYMTFVLRALGYSEEAGDFKYETALSDALSLGVIDSQTLRELQNGEFRRDQVMHISYLALSAETKGSSRTLLSKLVANGAVDGNAANEFLRG